jgi:hypothetical protein
MKKIAGILKICCTFVLIVEIIALAMVAFTAGALALAGSFSGLAAKEGSPFTISVENMTPAEMDEMKPVVLIALALVIVSLVLVVIGTLKTRTALNECRKERPFSEKCMNAVKISARMEVISGLFGIVSSLFLGMAASSLKINGSSIGGTSSSTASLTFVIYALQKYLLYHIARYGHSLETDPERR